MAHEQERERQRQQTLRVPSRGAEVTISDALKQTSKEIKMLNYEIQRVISSDEEAFVRLEHNISTCVDLIENIPIFCRVNLPARAKADDYRLVLPLHLTLANLDCESTSLDVYLSMNTKEPSSQRHDKHAQYHEFRQG